MKINKLLRDVHYWLSLVVLAPLGVMIIAGIILMLKKEIAWIQPPTRAGVLAVQDDASDPPNARLDDLFQTARLAKPDAFNTWQSLDRVEIKPDKGIIKFVSTSRWEAQVDLQTAELLQLAYRRSDLIEQIHDGSFFADWTKLYVFLPAGGLLLIMWATGIYLLILPHWARARKKRRKTTPHIDGAIKIVAGRTHG
ncbi:MAG TPA: hypothetical protein DCZ49_03000 [Hyphomonadaceae bacterium]|nr:hypothetical protein [Hyphomonadaceae bacterium]